MSRAILNDTVHRANLDYYQHAWPKGNSMYWSMFTLGYAGLGNRSATNRFLSKSMDGFLWGPFKIWSEIKGGGGCPNFLTGAGIYLQSIWAGYVGLKYSDDSLQLRALGPPAGSEGVRVRGVSYAGARLMVTVSPSEARVSLMTAGPERLVITIAGAAAVSLTTQGVSVPLGHDARIYQHIGVASVR